jgi:hypothetical protein
LLGLAFSLFLPWVVGFCETRGVYFKGKVEIDGEPFSVYSVGILWKKTYYVDRHVVLRSDGDYASDGVCYAIRSYECQEIEEMDKKRRRAGIVAAKKIF